MSLQDIYYVMKENQKRQQEKLDSMQLIYEKTIENASDESVDAFISYINANGLINTPNQWNRVRNLWILCNESPNITTEKKYQLKKELMLSGLWQRK